APARQAALGAGLPLSAPCTTLNKMCGSGMKAAMVAHDQLRAGNGRTVVAGGMESMSNAPHLSGRIRRGVRLGCAVLKDHLFVDGLEDAYDRGRLMGTYAEDCAERYQFSRTEQDDYARASLERALTAQNSEMFDAEIVPVPTTNRGHQSIFERDEQPARAKPDKIAKLKPAFRDGGSVTAANASSISDGAAALVLAGAGHAEELGLHPRAIIIGHAVHAQAPGLFTTAPVPAVRKLLARIGWSEADVDLWEINEAFAVVPMAFMRETSISFDRVNVHGGACALGHPIGASGTRIIVTLLNALEQLDLRRGVAAICIGGGEGTAIAVERI
ncbi:MAG: acetyl-CoA C-acyltransferase, partial [Pseudomonadota bacterium]